MGPQGEPPGEPTDRARRAVASRPPDADAERATPPVESLGDDRVDRVRTCGGCGETSTGSDDRADLSWSTSVENGRRLDLCPVCTRANVRAIEGKLRSEWW
jgi:hypothetical protein